MAEPELDIQAICTTKKIDNLKINEVSNQAQFQVEWEIEDIFSNFRTYCSPDFCFAGYSWTLWLEENFVGGAYLYLTNETKTFEYLKEINVKFGLKKVDGSLMHIATQDWTNVVLGKTEVRERRKELMPSNVLTIVCTLQRNVSDSTGPSTSHELEPLKLIKLDTLSENFKNLFINKDDCDVILRVQEKEFNAHKTILKARSSVFASMFKHDTSENQTGTVTIPDCDPDSFHFFLEFLYSGKLEGITFQNVLHLYSISDKYNVQELKSFCVENMELHLTENNVCEVIALADLYEEASLLTAAQGFINSNPEKIMETSEWENLLKNNYRLANRVIKSVVQNTKNLDKRSSN